MNEKNPVGLDGIEFAEFASNEPKKLQALFKEFGFSKTMQHKKLQVDYYNQNDIHFLVNREPQSFSAAFTKAHGPCLSSMGWRTADPKRALAAACARGAKPCPKGDYSDAQGNPIPAIYGIGDSIIYFVPADGSFFKNAGFVEHPNPEKVQEKGFTVIDHLTNNVEKGAMEQWSKFYKDIFGFTEIRYFDIRGAKTGLLSYALKSPCGKFCIPINEGTEAESQINEYLREYKGAGVQHIAFATKDIVNSLKALSGTSIETLDIDNEYYATVFDRVPNVTEDHKTLQKYNILVDGDDEGYLLQIFTKNVIGPIFIEIIQRKNHFNFGEGNFGALFRAIERDQQRRGVL